MNKTNIPWTEYTTNPSVGCEMPLISDGCQECYARKSHNRRHEAYKAGKKLPKQYAKPFKVIQLFPERLDDILRKKKPSRIFVGSTTDLFCPSVPFDFLDKVRLTTLRCPQHIFQILTKRPERLSEYCKAISGVWPKNVWFGGSVSNQPDADRVVPILLQIPAAKTFISVEPMLAAIDFSGSPTDIYCTACTGPHDCNWEGQEDEVNLLEEPEENYNEEAMGLCPKCGSEVYYGPSSSKTLLDGISQVIIGCESLGRKAGRFQDGFMDAAIDLVHQCKSTSPKLAVFVKQVPINGKVVKDINLFPKDLQYQEYPE